jgi:hypothetical protein
VRGAESARSAELRMSINAPTYLLAKHVFLCMHGSDVVFLDLKEDKYLSMEAAKVRSVLSLPMPSFRADGLSRGGETESLGNAVGQRSAQALLKRGLLTTDRSTGKQVEIASVEEAEADLIGIAQPIQADITPIDVVRFVTATISAWKAIRFGSLEAIVAKVSERRVKHPNGAAHIDLDRAKSCMALFERMRPYMFSARDKCLFESFVLANFLAMYGLYPEWVFGVRTDPFAAHCWLQHRRVVFNDYAEHAGEFTPIMII